MHRPAQTRQLRRKVAALPSARGAHTQRHETRSKPRNSTEDSLPSRRSPALTVCACNSHALPPWPVTGDPCFFHEQYETWKNMQPRARRCSAEYQLRRTWCVQGSARGTPAARLWSSLPLACMLHSSSRCALQTASLLLRRPTLPSTSGTRFLDLPRCGCPPPMRRAGCELQWATLRMHTSVAGGSGCCDGRLSC